MVFKAVGPDGDKEDENMTVLSTRCQCSACMRKYDCDRYAKVVEMQRLTKRYANADGLVIRFQVEKCDKRVTEDEKE